MNHLNIVLPLDSLNTMGVCGGTLKSSLLPCFVVDSLLVVVVATLLLAVEVSLSLKLFPI